MTKSVYIETTIPGAYYEEREDVVSRFQRHMTRRWWDERRHRYELLVSEAVLSEIEGGSFPFKAEALSLIEGVPLLRLTEDIAGVARTYVKNLVMPGGQVGDSVHLAFACVREVDYLLTWNCRHLANPNKTEHITRINRRLGLLTPAILTPQMLFEEYTDDQDH